jgi:hypothetical protein
VSYRSGPLVQGPCADARLNRGLKRASLGSTRETDEQNEKSSDSALALLTWARVVLSLSLIGLAAVHVIFPEPIVDAVFLGLLVFAGRVWFFDFRSVEWLKIREDRGQIRRGKDAGPTPSVSEAIRLVHSTVRDLALGHEPRLPAQGLVRRSCHERTEGSVVSGGDVRGSREMKLS